MKLENAIQKCFDRCNLQADNVEIYKEMFRYKAIRDLEDAEIDMIYNYISMRLGYMPNITNEQRAEIENNVYSIINPDNVETSETSDIEICDIETLRNDVYKILPEIITGIAVLMDEIHFANTDSVIYDAIELHEIINDDCVYTPIISITFDNVGDTIIHDSNGACIGVVCADMYTTKTAYICAIVHRTTNIFHSYVVKMRKEGKKQ